MLCRRRPRILIDDAAQRLLDAPDMPVPEPAELRMEIEALRGRRA
jgi:hypothetical protein